MKNTLIIVGVGIKFLSHLTVEVEASIKKSDKVLYLVNDPAVKIWIKKANQNNESLDFLYNSSQIRKKNYLKIAEYINNTLNCTKTLCFVMYGHPTFLGEPSIYAINLAAKSGHDTYVLPGVSSEGCLFADLKIDPSTCGCQSFEATDFIVYNREFDTSCHLVLFQIGMIGIKENYKNQNPKIGLEILKKYLLEKYSTDHTVILYEAAQYPLIKPTIKEIFLMDLSEYKVTPLTTLYVPPNKLKSRNEIYVNMLNAIN
jgi:tetrapyrrole methylase family protein/MazG family protein